MLLPPQHFEDASGVETAERLPDGYTVIGNLRLRNNGGSPQRRENPEAPWVDLVEGG